MAQSLVVATSSPLTCRLHVEPDLPHSDVVLVDPHPAKGVGSLEGLAPPSGAVPFAAPPPELPPSPLPSTAVPPLAPPPIGEPAPPKLPLPAAPAAPAAAPPPRRSDQDASATIVAFRRRSCSRGELCQLD